MARRLFFALWPGVAQREALAALARARHHKGGGGRLVNESKLHITLVFLDNVGEDTRVCVEEVAETIRARPFELCLDRLGLWSRSGIWWAGCSGMPDTLPELVTALQDGLRGCDFTPESRPYHAHVTLARKAKRAPRGPISEPIVWPVSDFVLVESAPRDGVGSGGSGVEYRVLRRWPLRAARLEPGDGVRD